MTSFPRVAPARRTYHCTRGTAHARLPGNGRILSAHLYESQWTRRGVAWRQKGTISKTRMAYVKTSKEKLQNCNENRFISAKWSFDNALRLLMITYIFFKRFLTQSMIVHFCVNWNHWKSLTVVINSCYMMYSFNIFNPLFTEFLSFLIRNVYYCNNKVI